MGRRTKKEAERFLAREFLAFMGFKLIRLVSAEKPDIFATVEKGERRLRVGIELTEYYVDAPPSTRSGSPTARVEDFWQEVQTSIRRRVAQRRELWHVTGLVFLKEKEVPKGGVALGVARELVELAMEQAVPPQGEACLAIFSSSYPLLRQFVSEVYLSGTGRAIRLSWTCGTTSAANVGVVSQYIIEIIRTKSAKAEAYDWKGAQERWLLICATGSPIVSSAGPHPEFVDWKNAHLVEAAKNSGFDRLFFWERPWDWCKPLWPDGEIVSKENKE